MHADKRGFLIFDPRSSACIRVQIVLLFGAPIHVTYFTNQPDNCIGKLNFANNAGTRNVVISAMRPPANLIT